MRLTLSLFKKYCQRYNEWLNGFFQDFSKLVRSLLTRQDHTLTPPSCLFILLYTAKIPVLFVFNFSLSYFEKYLLVTLYVTNAHWRCQVADNLARV